MYLLSAVLACFFSTKTKLWIFFIPQISEVQILNPSDTLILVQLLPIALYQEPTSVLDFLSDRFDPELIETDDPGVFYLANKTDKDSPGKCLKNTSCGAIEETFGVKPNRTALTFAIKPRQNITVSIGFKPSDGRERISLVLIRNNLTILDAFMVRGQGARGELRFNSKIPSASSNLLFELKPTHLVDCDSEYILITRLFLPLCCKLKLLLHGAI